VAVHISENAVNFDDYVKHTLMAVTARSEGDMQMALRVRALTEQALAQASFVIACAARIVTTLESGAGALPNVPLYGPRGAPISIRVFYWPPGFQNAPHVHNSWTVTGVLHNSIVAETFRGAACVADVDLSQSTRFAATAGKAGYLLPPCVHRLQNASQRPAATLHVFSNGDARRNTVTTPPQERPPPRPEARSFRRLALTVIVEMLAAIGDARILPLYDRVFAIGDNTVRLQVVKALMQYDVGLAYMRSRELEELLKGADRAALAKINAGLASSRASSATG
jgi:hypothetical protein